MPFTFKLSQRLARMRAPTALAGTCLLALTAAACDLRPTGPGSTISRLTIVPKFVALRQNDLQDFTVVGFTPTGDTARISVSWSLSAGALVDTSSQGGHHYGKYKASTCGTTTVVATGHPGKVSDTATVTVTCTATVQSVAVSPSAASVTAGSVVQLNATPLDSTGQPVSGQTISWSSGNTSVATVDGSGRVTGMGAGAVAVTAQVSGTAGQAQVTVTSPVTQAPVARVTLAPATTSSVVGGSQQFVATLTDANGNVLSGRTISWVSSAPSIATVSASGLASALAVGTASVTATSEGITGSAAFAVTAPPPAPVAHVTLTPSSASVAVGGSQQFVATLTDANGNVLSGRTISWVSSAPSIATVSASGLASALAVGTASVTATSEGINGSAAFAVTAPPPAPVAHVTLTPSSASVAVGGSQQFVATLTDANGNVLSGRTISWVSSAPSIAAVSAGGLVSALVAGTSTVTATSEGISGSAPLTVTLLPPPTSGSWANEPAGFTTITDYDVGAQTIPTCSDCGFGTGGWSVLNPNGNVASLNDPLSTPLSAPWDGQWRYPAGFSGGSAPGTMYYAGLSGSRDLYVGYWWKPSNPWQGHMTNVNKVSFLFAGDGGSGKLSEAIMYGSPGGPYKLRIILEFYTSDSHGSGSRWLVPNVNSDNIALGQWHRIEIHMRHSTTTTSQDGIVQWWMDGRQQGNYSDVNFVSEGWNMFQFSPTWGGMGDTKTETDYFWYDHVHLSHQ